MATGEGTFDSGNINEVEIEIDVATMVRAILKNPDAMNKLVVGVRDAMLKDARTMGTLFRQWGGTQ